MDLIRSEFNNYFFGGMDLNTNTLVDLEGLTNCNIVFFFFSRCGTAARGAQRKTGSGTRTSAGRSRRSRRRKRRGEERKLGRNRRKMLEEEEFSAMVAALKLN